VLGGSSVDPGEARQLLLHAHARLTELRTELDDARDRIVHLELALQTNRQIALALGILMARRGLTLDDAFDLLRRMSQRTQRPVRELADDVVYTGDLPGEAVG